MEFLKNSAKKTQKDLLWSFWLACNFIKKRLQHRCFFSEFVKFLRTPFLWNNSGGYYWTFVIFIWFIGNFDGPEIDEKAKEKMPHQIRQGCNV